MPAGISHHPGKVRGGAGPDDQHPQAALPGGAGIFRGALRRAVCARNRHLERDAKALQGVGRLDHDVVIAVAAHEDSDQRLAFHALILLMVL
jgi:hypothetical protein